MTMASMRSMSLSSVAFAAHAFLTVLAHGPSKIHLQDQGPPSSLPRASTQVPNGINILSAADSSAARPDSLNWQCRARIIAEVSNGAHSTLEVRATAESSTPEQLLELSTFFMNRGEFRLAKSALAACACLFHPRLNAIHAFAGQLRWRMGLQHLSAPGLDDWLAWKQLLQVPLEQEWIEESSLAPDVISLSSVDKRCYLSSIASTCAFIVLICLSLGVHTLCLRWPMIHNNKDAVELRIKPSGIIDTCALLGDDAECPPIESSSTTFIVGEAAKSDTCHRSYFDAPEESCDEVDEGPFVQIQTDCMEYFEDAVSMSEHSGEQSNCVSGDELVYVSSEESTTEGSQTCSSDLHSQPVVKKASRQMQRYAFSDIRFLERVDKLDFALVNQVRALSKEAFGEHEDAWQIRKGEHICAILVGDKVASYASYMLRRDLMALSINKLAVARAEQKRGLGRLMIRHLIQIAKHRSRSDTPIEVLSLSALPTSIGFYRACGFHEDCSVKLRDSDDIIEGQVYMEHRLKRKRVK